MSANRKLQTEIQQVLKKVEEGVELFDDIWGKVYAAEQQALKEKYEADLKKEIKKLQRLRDQIKTWLGSSEIKDKLQLTEARKIIESKMEQFKVCEKDTKTKAYSREGLAREARLDPKEAEREEKRNWTNECLDRLNSIVDSVEADIEKLSGGRAKSKNKEQLEKLENRIKKNKWHIARLEQVLKLIDNDELDLTKIDAIKDDVEYYIETAIDDDGALGIDDEFDIYEELQLDAIAIRANEAESDESNDDVTSVTTLMPEPVPPIEALLQSESEDSKVKKNPSPTPSAPPPNKIPTIAVPPIRQVPPVSAAKLPAKSSVVIPPAITPTIPNAPTKVTNSPTIQAISRVSANPLKSLPETASKPMIAPTAIVPSKSAFVDINDVNSIKTDQTSALAGAGSWAILASSPSIKQPAALPIVVKQVDAVNANIPTSVASSISPNPANTSNHSEQVNISNSGSMTMKNINNSMLTQDKVTSQPALSMLQSDSLSHDLLTAYRPSQDLIGIPLMLRLSMLTQPESLEIEKPSSYLPRNPTITHPSFPTVPVAIPDNQQFFDKIPVDTLFLMFYYQQGSLQQYLAAKKLKQSSWRFHKKYLTWFQRHEEPKKTTDQYEEGTYVYFDYESGWCQRIKTEFKFEYAYLEDDC